MRAQLSRKREGRLSRDERARLTRDGLLAAGCTVVAAEGYAATSIAKIADTAGVAHGTFYNYFFDRQALFDELLPYEGRRMIKAIETAAFAAESGLPRELARFEAFLRYVADNPGFYRILYEAEVFAPRAHKEHVNNIIVGYRRTIARAFEKGQVAPIPPEQVDCVIHQLLGMRAYAAMQIHYEEQPAKRLRLIENSLAVYRVLISQGLFIEPDA